MLRESACSSGASLFLRQHGHVSGKFPFSGELETAEWVIPRGYRQQEGEARFIFVHGSDNWNEN